LTSQVEIRPEPSSSALATRLLSSFIEEIGTRLPGGFDPARSVSASPEEMAPPAGDFLVVVDPSGDGVGCGGLKDLGSAIFEIKRMWIAPTHRGRGYARALLVALEERARELGAIELRLDSSSVLNEAVALYRSCGYVEIAPYNDNRYASLWFAKVLAVST
jgi:GNAT superfamily N-acetyltransferase